MKRMIGGAAVVALSVALTATSAAQQAGALVDASIVSDSPGEMTERAIEGRLRRAQRYAEQGDFSRASREFEWVAMEQRARGSLPREALSHLAGVQIAAGKPLDAAETLLELGRLADLHGNPGLRAAALLEAATLYRRNGKPEAALEQLGNLVEALEGPDFSREARERILARMGS